MTQAHDDVPSGARAGEPRAGLPIASATPFDGWLALADPDGPIDLKRLFPEVEIRVEPTSASFSDALSASEPSLLVLMAPPAGPGDLQRAASWLDEQPRRLRGHAQRPPAHRAEAPRARTRVRRLP